MNRGYRTAGEQQQLDKKAQALRLLANTIVLLVLLGFFLKILFF